MRICISCGRRAGDRPLAKLPLSLSPDLGICDGCSDTLWRRGVRSGVQREADRLLASGDKSHFTPYLPQVHCRHCGAPVLYDNAGRQPLWCAACDRERMQLAIKGVA
jgi:hypothetical protein